MKNALWMLGTAATFLAVYLSEATAGVYFTPGDAFFHASTTTDAFAKVVKRHDGFVTLRYDPPESPPPTLGADLGFHSLKVINGGQRMCDEISAAVSRLVAGSEEPEKGVVDIFIYNKSFNPKTSHIGLKYNETWVEPVHNAIFANGDQVGGQATIVSSSVYSPFATSKKMVVEDWLNAARVEELAVTVPKDVVWRRFGRPLNEVVEIDFDKCMILLVRRKDLQNVIERHNNATFLRLMDGETVQFRRQDGSWVRTDEKAEAN